MDNKLSEPSDNITDTLNSLRGWKQLAEAAEKRISALLAELEASSLQCRGIEQERELFRVERTAHQQHAQELEKRITELEAYNTRLRDYNAGLAQESCELQAKLATPVRLSGTTHPRCRQQHADDIRAAGFKCVGDE
ncbi:hypothetical protein [Serratia liquefaciens]|uniref:hypothetical protein n=1 Tax=Serratia liquefaciens TaxID=614 RepID=UPI002182B12B|nr:hypothetical protein [Serratia liquefaciens]CAI2406760.1 Uncharacterised protein [Serratia liquefaciens]